MSRGWTLQQLRAMPSRDIETWRCYHQHVPMASPWSAATLLISHIRNLVTGEFKQPSEWLPEVVTVRNGKRVRRRARRPRSMSAAAAAAKFGQDVGAR